MVFVHFNRERSYFFFWTMHNTQKAAAFCCLAVQALCSTGLAPVVVERLRDFDMALEMSGQVLLCPCSVRLFSRFTGWTRNQTYEASTPPFWGMHVQMDGQVSFPPVFSARVQP